MATERLFFNQTYQLISNLEIPWICLNQKLDIINQNFKLEMQNMLNADYANNTTQVSHTLQQLIIARTLLLLV